jgi:hypothetical protein
LRKAAVDREDERLPMRGWAINRFFPVSRSAEFSRHNRNKPETMPKKTGSIAKLKNTTRVKICKIADLRIFIRSNKKCRKNSFWIFI